MAVAFTSANNRRYWQSAFFSSLLWIAVAVAIGFAVGRDGGNPWLVAAFAYGAFIALSILWWISRAIVGWLVWRVIWKRSAVNDLVAAFEKAKFPKPSTNLDSPEAYFEDVVEEETLEFTCRIAAGALLLRIVEFARGQGIWQMLRTKAAYEDALAAYRATFPRD